jgi:hypothetical protein
MSDNGFNIGEDEYSKDMGLNLSLKSKELDPYFVGTSEGKKVVKPCPSGRREQIDFLTKLVLLVRRRWC